ncbi:hypothetical protein FHS27_004038 [Rhodopirellula rubra]|uniref:YwiC-like protein n=1 Tax=Aporhodopirellula rubra TaxID=980271 RepID=A0A7W5E125_9BACT|nr:YwiC-like family protein [Aporhodopirellula rubra]MBB3208211.1 hypothetical protein [Aporhodopirellula rubra]
MSSTTAMPADSASSRPQSNASQSPGASAKLQPKEHGAYAILGIPMVTALVIAGPSVPGWCVVGASIAGFLAHEPLLVAAGHRGQRAKRATPAARGQLVALLGIATACGLIALFTGSNAVRLALAACALMAVSSFALGLNGQHRTLAGQMWGVVGLSIPCVPILLAGGVVPVHAFAVWSTWLIGFGATTMAVRGVIAAQKRRSKILHWSCLIAFSLLTGVLIAVGHSLAITVVPMLVMSVYLLLYPPPARHLKRVGWTLVGGTVASAAWMIVIA